MFDTALVMIDPANGGCLAQTGYRFEGGSFGGIAQCENEVAWVGVHTYTHPPPGQTVQCFACDEHRDELEHARRFGTHAADHLVLARRRAGGIAK